jgi:hypothetical protein
VRLGGWARSGGFVGLVAAHADGQVTLFDPAARQTVRVPATELEALPAGAVRVTVELELPLAHGLAEDDVRRWVASLVDGVLRERATQALADAGLDPGPALPAVQVDVRPAGGVDALCLAGHRTPSDGPTACATCGREAVPPP